MNFGQSTIWLEHKYLGLLSSHLSQFKRSGKAYRFRCPFCGDSQTNKLKSRGYVFEHKGHLVYKCHNCGVSTGVGRLVEQVNPELYREFKFECIKEAGSSERKEKPKYEPDIGKFNKPRFSQYNPLKVLKKISALDMNHGAARYVRERQIPSHFHHKLYYCPKFYAWVNHIVPGKFKDELLKNDEPRLIIPFIDQNGYVFGFQGRSFRKKTDLRYITIMLDEDRQKVFGLDSIDFSKDCFILEGPIDSMFLPNALAMAGSDGISDLVPRSKAIVIYDNEPRNKEITKKIQSAIEQGFRVVIWPDHILFKDVNDMILNGMSQDEVLSIIHTNTFQGLAALTRFNSWKKVN